jgi:hypothetical protein
LVGNDEPRLPKKHSVIANGEGKVPTLVVVASIQVVVSPPALGGSDGQHDDNNTEHNHGEGAESLGKQTGQG